jgi:hypothetical protein
MTFVVMGALAAVLKAADLMAAEMSAAARADRASPPDTDRSSPAGRAATTASGKAAAARRSFGLANLVKCWRALQESNLRPAA